MTTRESVTNSGDPNANQDSLFAVLSADGRFVVFTSTATNLVASPASGGLYQAYLHDRCISAEGPVAGCTPTTEMVSLTDAVTPTAANRGSR